MNHRWLRVSKQNPCTVCGRFDWDTYCPELGLACCMRETSARPARNGGWIHKLDGPAKPPPIRVAPERIPTIDAAAIMARFCAETWPEMVGQLAASLGVRAESLDDLGVGWATGHNAWGFPMRDWRGNIIGVRLRDSTGHKWAVRGSRAGLFYTEAESKTCYVTEGPTDTAAGLSIGLDCIGRPSCLGCELEVDRLLARKKCRQVVIISDNDGPGYRGAVKLADSLSVPSVCWVPPCKDLREFSALGGTKELIDSLTRSLLWTQPKKREHHQTQIVADQY